MSLITNVRDVGSLIGPYFVPSKNNLPRIATLIGYLGLSALQARYDDGCAERIGKAISFFQSKRIPVVDFPQTFKEAILKGLLPSIGFKLGTDWLINQLAVLLRNDFIQTQIHQWLHINQQATVSPRLKHAAAIIGNDCSNLVQITTSALETSLRVPAIILSLRKIYQLAATLHRVELPFPFNIKNGLFGCILLVGAVFTTFQVYVQNYLKQASGQTEDGKRDILDNIQWVEGCRQQIVSLPEENRQNLIERIEIKTSQILKRASFAQMGFIAQWSVTFLVPRIFSLMTSYLHYLFVTKVPSFDEDENLSTVIEKSISFLWEFVFLVQNITNIRSSFELCAGQVQALQKACVPIKPKISLSVGEALEVNKVSLAFENKIVFKDFSISLPLGSTYWIQGENGCGKSVLCRIIQGLQDAEKGSVIKPKEVVYLQPILGIRPSFMTFTELLQTHFGIQDKTLILAIKEELLKQVPYQKEPRLEPDEQGQEKLEQWDNLSLGQKQILNWVVMLKLAHKNSEQSCLLIGDEALGQLDKVQKQEMLKRLRSWVQANPAKRGLVLIDHAENTEKLEKIDSQGICYFNVYKDLG